MNWKFRNCTYSKSCGTNWGKGTWVSKRKKRKKNVIVSESTCNVTNKKPWWPNWGSKRSWHCTHKKKIFHWPLSCTCIVCFWLKWTLWTSLPSSTHYTFHFKFQWPYDHLLHFFMKGLKTHRGIIVGGHQIMNMKWLQDWFVVHERLNKFMSFFVVMARKIQSSFLCWCQFPLLFVMFLSCNQSTTNSSHTLFAICLCRPCHYLAKVDGHLNLLHLHSSSTLMWQSQIDHMNLQYPLLHPIAICPTKTKYNWNHTPIKNSICSHTNN